jgi:hypothetical protein
MILHTDFVTFSFGYIQAAVYTPLIGEEGEWWMSVNANGKRICFSGLVALLMLLSACTSSPVVEPETAPKLQNFMATTDDLGMVADEALQLAGRLGPEQVLVVFDIDNTLLAMEQGLGSDQWYYWQKDLQKEDPCSGLLVSDRFMVQGALYFASAMRPTQADAAGQVRRLQDAGLKVIAVTSRGTDYRLQTFRELRRNGISFWPGALPPQRGFSEIFIPEGGSLPALYEDGVFLTSGQDKGVMIQALLMKTGRPAPAVIVIADDKGNNLKDVMAAFDSGEAAADWDELRPALIKIEQILGPDNYDLPVDVIREGCGPM